jgi:hypothetical protein
MCDKRYSRLRGTASVRWMPLLILVLMSAAWQADVYAGVVCVPNKQFSERSLGAVPLLSCDDKEAQTNKDQQCQFARSKIGLDCLEYCQGLEGIVHHPCTYENLEDIKQNPNCANSVDNAFFGIGPIAFTSCSVTAVCTCMP